MRRLFGSDTSGTMSVATALTALPILVGAAGAVDYHRATQRASMIQNALDAAVIAAANAELSGAAKAEVDDLAERIFFANLDRDPQSVAFRMIDRSEVAALFVEASEGKGEEEVAVAAVATTSMPAMINLMPPWQISRRSLASASSGMEACILSLDPAAASAFKVQGSTIAQFEDCIIAANSTSDSAVYRGGSSVLAAECVITSGRTSGLDSASVTTVCDAPLERQSPSRDPLRNVVAPSTAGACQSVPNGKQKTLQPGIYCEQKWSGEISLEPGSYVLRGGSINLGGNGILIGEGVTIFLVEGAHINIGANEIVQLSPPAEGPYAGITLYQPKDNTQAVSLLGTSGSEISGFIYAPGAQVFYAGNSVSTASPSCLRIVGKTIELTGNSQVASNCEDELGGRKMWAGRNALLMQ